MSESPFVDICAEYGLPPDAGVQAAYDLWRKYATRAEQLEKQWLSVLAEYQKECRS